MKVKLLADVDHERPALPEEFEEDATDYKTPNQSLGKATPNSVRRSLRNQSSQFPAVRKSATPKARRVSAPGTPRATATPKGKKVTATKAKLNPVSKPSPKINKLSKVSTPKGRRSRRSEPATPKHRPCTDETNSSSNGAVVKANDRTQPTEKQQSMLRPKSNYRRSVPNLQEDTTLKVNPKTEKEEVPLKRARSLRGRPETLKMNVAAPKARAKSVERPVRAASAGPCSLALSLTADGTHNTSHSNPGRNSSLNRSLDNHRRLRTRSATKVESTKMQKSKPVLKPRLTLPTSPSFMRRKTVKDGAKGVKTTEQLELERIERLKKTVEAKRKEGDRFYQASLKSTSYIPVQSTAPLTKPSSMNFATDERVKGVLSEAKAVKEVDFPRLLRNHRQQQDSKSQGHQPLKPTVPQPFNLTDRKRKLDEQPAAPSKFHSMAEVEKSVFGKTPERFRSKPRNAKGPSPAKRHKSGDDGRGELTIPKTPKFETRNRKREYHVISQAEREEMELEEMEKQQFKAHPLNEKILQQVNLGVKKVPAKELTQPAPFDLETYKRNEAWQSHKKEEMEPKPFQAHPVPTAILRGPVGVRPAKQIAPTVPESPAFALKERLRPRRQPSLPQPEEVKNLMKQHKVPYTGIPFQPKIEHRTIELQPFSFEERDKRRMAQKDMKIKSVLDEEKKLRDFHANPLPDLSPEVLQKKKYRSPTKPEPFRLEVDDRGAKRAEGWSKQLEENLRKGREMATFKAKPADVLKHQPFVPTRSTKPLTDVTEVALNTERRHEERSEFDKWRKEKEQEQALRQLAAEKARQEEEEERLKQMRAEAEVKAQPIRRYRSLRIKPSDAPLTNPKTPNFSTRLRTRSSHNRSLHLNETS